ncbi:hypothetical protein HCK01_36560, partial [Streptomyces sp. AA8]|uniref:hypothetical protein n=1 Tax=Streptomyces telluris TaxID=2720021 RepID=UPI00143C2811
MTCQALVPVGWPGSGWKEVGAEVTTSPGPAAGAGPAAPAVPAYAKGASVLKQLVAYAGRAAFL